MKKTKTLLSILLALALMLALAACGGLGGGSDSGSDGGSGGVPADKFAVRTETAPDLSEWAGEYTFYCALFGERYLADAYELGEVAAIGDRYVEYPEFAGDTVTLDPDGTGYLYWGEDNQGPIDSWSMKGEDLRFQAGVSDVKGTIVDGFMTVELEDGFWICFTAPGVQPGIELISVDDYIDLLLGLEQEPDESEPEGLAEGEYTCFAILTDGLLVDALELDVESYMTLIPDGTGLWTMNEESMGIASWEVEDHLLTVVLEDDSWTDGPIHDGVAELDVMGDGSMIAYYARTGADISGYHPMTLEEARAAYEAGASDTLTRALWESIDGNAGAHLVYSATYDYSEADVRYDAQAKDGVYRSARSMQVGDYEDTLITFFRDGTVYNLHPEDMTGLVATRTSSSIIAENVLMLDELYSTIYGLARRGDCTEDVREMDGISYAAEVFPAMGGTPETALLFDDDGALAWCLMSDETLGETVYRIDAIDDNVDESLFDISDYDIEE